LPFLFVWSHALRLTDGKKITPRALLPQREQFGDDWRLLSGLVTPYAMKNDSSGFNTVQP
jgi:hypothetical protein